MNRKQIITLVGWACIVLFFLITWRSCVKNPEVKTPSTTNPPAEKAPSPTPNKDLESPPPASAGSQSKPDTKVTSVSHSLLPFNLNITQTFTPKEYKGWKAESAESGKKIRYTWASQDDPKGAELIESATTRLQVNQSPSLPQRAVIKGKIGKHVVLLKWEGESFFLSSKSIGMVSIEDEPSEGLKQALDILKKNKSGKEWILIEKNVFDNIKADFTAVTLWPAEDGDENNFVGTITVPSSY